MWDWLGVQEKETMAKRTKAGGAAPMAVDNDSGEYLPCSLGSHWKELDHRSPHTCAADSDEDVPINSSKRQRVRPSASTAEEQVLAAEAVVADETVRKTRPKPLCLMAAC
jgi:hypothetical protein